MATNNGIELPVSLQIKNLQDIANQIKQFASKNVLADSLGGKKIDSELSKILSRLEQISAKSKTAFTAQSDFTSVEKDVSQVELGLNRVQSIISNLNFSDLKIPSEVSGEMDALQSRIKELNNSLMIFKGTQKEKLVNNQDFLADLQAADPARAAKMLEKGYDELFQAVNQGMGRVNADLAIKVAEYKRQQQLLTQNEVGKTSMTQWGALSFLQEAFKELPTDSSKQSDSQKLMAEFMNTATNEAGMADFTTFKHGNAGYSAFLKRLREKFEFTPEQINEIRARIKEQATSLKKTASEVIRDMGTDADLAKNVLFGSSASSVQNYAAEYEKQQKIVEKALSASNDAAAKSASYQRVVEAFDAPNKEIKQKSEEIAAALKVPQSALQGFEASILSAATKSPQLTALFQSASREIATLTSTVDQGRQKLQAIDNTINKMQGVSNFINRYVGIYAIVRKVTTAIKNALNNIRDLDKAITAIAVVTNMSQEDLWGKIGEYTQMAQQYGVATKDVYEVSQIFYQQGLQTSQVMEMTTESLKMAKIAGIDYTTAANAMTVAVRAFKLEMSEAQSVTDTYSALAAKFAVSSSEIANAMEKTASSAASVGMSLQSTSAFISVMEQTTRESAQNIGSALKSIISRYGEMKASPDKLLNVEGEDVAFNKVDTALKSVGISIKDASGQFRNFDDVIMELASKWNNLDNNTQRYIATIMAGNRQQSRFIALVSNYDELSRAMSVANNAENASIVQVAKTMESLESKTNQLKNAFSQLYLDLHIEDGLKNAYDWLTRIVTTIGKLGTLKGVLPTLMNVVGLGTGAKTLVQTAMNSLQDKKSKLQVETTETEQKIAEIRAKASEDIKTKWQIEADLSQLEAAQAQIQGQITVTGQSIGTQIMEANPALASRGISSQEILDTATRMQREGKLKTDDDRAYFMKGYDIDPQSEQGQAIDILLQAFGKLSTQAEQFGTTLDNIKGAGERAVAAMDNKSAAEERGQAAVESKAGAEEQAKSAVEQKVQTEQTRTNAAVQAAQADYDAAKAAADKARADLDAERKVRVHGSAHVQAKRDVLFAAEAYKEAARKVLEKAQADAEGENAERREAHASQEAADADLREAGAGNTKSETGLSLTNWGKGNAMKYASIATGIARLAGTAITAAGAAHEDKSTDKAETSKILTGVGNGLSMAGTGASMLMSLGPWAAAVGAIGGFLIGGLGAIIDGATMTLEEQLALEKQEASKAADESLKQQAKVTDISSQLENLKVLQKNMYNSTDDMQAYTDAMNTLGQQYPALISAYDQMGNAIVDLQSAEEYLAKVRLQAASLAREAAVAEAKTRKTQIEILNNFDTELGNMVNGGQTMTSKSNQFKSSSAFILQSSRGESASTIAIRGNYSEDYGFGYGDQSQRTVATEFNEAFEALKKSNLEALPDNIREVVSYYKNHENEQISVDDFKTIGNYIADKASDAYPDVQSSFLTSGGGQVFLNDKQAFKNFVNQDISTAEQYDFGDAEQFISKLDSFLAENGETLGIGKKTAREYFNWGDKAVDLTQVQEAWRKLQAISEGYNRQVKILNQQVTKSYAQEELEIGLNTPENGINTTRGSTIANAGIFSSMIASGLEAAAKNFVDKEGKKFEDAASWAASEEGKADFVEEKQKLSQAILDWTKLLTDQQLEEFIAISGSMEEYLSADEILNNQKFKLTSADQSVRDEIISQFEQANQANRDRILKTIYSIDNNGNVTKGTLNSDLKGLKKFSKYVDTGLPNVDEEGIAQEGHLYEEQNVAFDIANLIDGKKIISKYSDYFTSQLISINDLAENGYTELASSRLDVLDSFSQALADMTSTQQKDMFSIVSNVNLSSYDSIQSAIKSMEDYGKKNNIADIGKDDKFGPLYEALTQQANNLLFNVNTLAQELTTTITNASKEIDTVISTNKSGLAFDKALEEFSNLQVKFSEITKFDQIFAYDASLGKYVYTSDGLSKAIAARQEKLNEEAKQLSETADIYTKQITGETKNGLVTKKPYANLDSIKSAFENKDNLWAAVRSTGIVDDTMSSQVKTAYESLVTDYIAATEETDRSAEKFRLYVQKRAQEAKDASDAAFIFAREYEANIKNQYYQAIDWSKLQLGTDYSGTNKDLVSMLAQELYTEEVEVNGKIERKIKDEYSEKFHNLDEVLAADTEQVIEDYFKTLPENMQDAARRAYKGQKQQNLSNQVSTAITELLNGAGQILTDTSIALLDKTDGLTAPADGVLTAGQNYVNSAIALYNAHKNNLLSIADKNNSFTSILNKQFEQSNQLVSTLSSGASLDINALSQTFTTFGLVLSDYYDAAASAENVWKGNNVKGISDAFANALKTDIFGKTQIIDWDSFVVGLGSKIDINKYIGTFEYQNAYSTYVDNLIKLDTQAIDLIRGQYDAAFNSITNGKKLNVSQFNAIDSAQLALNAGTLNNGILTITDTIQYASNAMRVFSRLSANPAELEKVGWTEADLAKNWKVAQQILTQNVNAWTSISENLGALTDDNISTLIEKGGLKINDMKDVFVKVGDKYVMTLTKYNDYLVQALGGDDAVKASPALQRKVNDAMAKAKQSIANNLTNIDWDAILKGTATAADWTTFQDTISSSIHELGLNLSDYYSQKNGQLSFDLGKLKNNIAKIDSDISKTFNKHVETTIASLQDAALGELSTAMEYALNGTNNMADLTSFTQRYNELTGNNFGLTTLFDYDTQLQSYTLSKTSWEAYKTAQKNYLKGIGLSETAVNLYLESQTQQLIKNSLDIESFLSSGYTELTSDSTQQLINQLRLLSPYLSDKYQEEWINEKLSALLSGGEEAVEVLKELKGDNVSGSEISTIFNNHVERLRNSLELMGSEAGTIVDSYTASLFNLAGATIKDLGNGQHLITSIPQENWGEKIAEAYMLLYNSLGQSAGATISDLNNAYAKILESVESNQSNAISALSNADSMTYTELGEILAKEGYKLEDVLADQLKYGIQSIGAGKIRIADFTKFAQEMNWDPHSEEYLSAFKTYNDSMIELNRKFENGIMEEVQSLSDMKIGDQINLTTLWTQITDSLNQKLLSEQAKDYSKQADAEGYKGQSNQERAHELADNAKLINAQNAVRKDAANALLEQLESYSATFKNGILTLNAGANVQGIIQAIASYAADYGNLLPDQLAELADTVEDYIKGIADIIKNGISGDLSNAQAQSLQSWATEQGLGKLDFTRTAEGLKLSTNSAIELYNALKEVDSIQAELVFDELNESIDSINENYKSFSALNNYITDLTKKINELKANRESLNEQDKKVTDAKIKQYETELSLAEEIKEARATTEDEGFNFMDNEIPSGQNNPINYLQNWSDAFEKIKETTKSGATKNMIDYSDFYNIITEMGNLADITGEVRLTAGKVLNNSQDAADLITQAAGALSVASDGSIKVDLSKIGIDFSTGAGNLKKDVASGISEVADAQIDMLDSLIALLEVIVAMEDLGDIDTEGNGIDLSDIFTVTYDDNGEPEIDTTKFSTTYAKWRESIIKKFQDYIDKGGATGTSEYIDLGKALEGIKIGNFDLVSLIKMNESELMTQADEVTRNAYLAVLTAFSKAAQSGNYDLDNIQQSILSVLKESGLQGTLTMDIGNTTIQINGTTMTTINWNDANTDAVLTKLSKQYNNNKDEAKKDLSKWIKEYGENTLTDSTKLTYVLGVKKKITYNDDGTLNFNIGGKEYKNIPEGQIDAYLAAATLDDWGIEVPEKFTTKYNGKTGTLEGTYKLGNKIVKCVGSKDGKVEWIGEYSGNHYTSEEAMLEGEWKYWEENELGKHYASQEEFNYGEYGIRATVKYKVTLNGNEVSVEGDPLTRNKIKEKLNEYTNDPNLASKLEVDSKGNVPITLDNGVVVTLSGDTVLNSDGSINTSAVLAELQKILGIDNGLVDNISTAITQAFTSENVKTAISDAIKTGLTSSIGESGEEGGVEVPLPKLTLKPTEISVDTAGLTPDADNIKDTVVQIPSLTLKPTSLAVDQTAITVSEEETPKIPGKVEYTADITNLQAPEGESVPKGSGKVDYTTGEVEKLDKQLAEGEVNWTNDYTAPTVNNLYRKVYWSHEGLEDQATGTIGLATGNAYAQGTLMGELGPELVVSGGHYFVVGQSGPEMVDLANDAIVFNHIQTKSLLEKGTSPGRGRAITNERNAVSYAKGNINGGPAMASASAALAALKQLRAQWQSLQKLSAKDLSNLGGSSGGGGGGSSSTSTAFLAELERWYNWLQKIDELEYKINTEEAKRGRIMSSWNKSGKDYFNTQLKNLDYLREEIDVQTKLKEAQQDYFDKRRDEMNAKNNPFSNLYTFNKYGQLQYKSNAFEKFTKLVGRDSDTGKANMTSAEQYAYITKSVAEGGLGINAKYLMYDTNGDEIDTSEDNWQQTAVEAFWDRIESDQSEMQDLFDSIHDLEIDIEENQEKQNELLADMRDNQLAVEEKVMNALVESQQRIIDGLSDEREKLQDATDKYINGLSDALNKEKEMYQQNETDVETKKLQRQLAILQRSGGSGAEIRSLQEQIRSRQQDAYFEEQQKQIDAIQEASDKELERLDTQIDIMQQTLDYEKQMGLLWDQVYNIMDGSAESIADFIVQNTEEFWGKSLLSSESDFRDTLFEASQWKEFSKRLSEGTLTYSGITGAVQFAKGGLVTSPTNAIIGETKKPEAVLNPIQTRILREDILGSRPTSLMNLLVDFKNAYEGIGTAAYSSTVDSGIVIENATVEMHVDQISNDYDARRAGEQALSEMLRIARKTSAKNSVGR